MPDDRSTTVADLKDAVEQFADRRDWKQFHDPKNLVMAMASELGELAEYFRWVSNEQSHAQATSDEHRQEITHELADVMMFALEFATVCEIDIASAIDAKLKINEARYPVESFKGSNRKYNKL